MPVIAGDPGAILSGGIGRLEEDEVATNEEILTRGHWTGLVPNVFPPEGADGLGSIEILYPIEPQMNANRLVYRNDALAWKVVRKSENDWRHEIVTLNYRVHRNSFPEFYDALLENKSAGKVITLLTPGVQPFIRPDEENPVFVLNIGKPVREFEFYWRIAVTFLRDPNFCFTVYDALEPGRDTGDWEVNGQIHDAGEAPRLTGFFDQKDAGNAPRTMNCGPTA